MQVMLAAASERQVRGAALGTRCLLNLENRRDGAWRSWKRLILGTVHDTSGMCLTMLVIPTTTKKNMAENLAGVVSDSLASMRW